MKQWFMFIHQLLYQVRHESEQLRIVTEAVLRGGQWGQGSPVRTLAPLCPPQWNWLQGSRIT